MRSKLVLVSFGVTLYAVLVFTLLSSVYWRSACNTCHVEETACKLHKVATGLFLSVVVTCFVVPFAIWFWIRCIRYFSSWAYTAFGGFLVSNATVVTSAATIVIIVEQYMCPSDKVCTFLRFFEIQPCFKPFHNTDFVQAIEFAAVVLIFVTQIFSGIVVEEVYIQQHEEKFKELKYRQFKNATTERLTSDEVNELENGSSEEL